jgi:GAF domain-containing protein
MEPIPETLEAIEELDAAVDDDSLLEQLSWTTARAQEVAPDLAGVSLALRAQGVTFTLVATDEESAALDGVQYLTSGPCVEALDDGQGVSTTAQDLFSEPRWHALGRASAATGVRSTLTFPVVQAGQVVATVNLYGRSHDTFDGNREALAAVFGAWAPGAVANADLSFSTRRIAEQAPKQLRREALVDTATGIVAANRGVSLDAAREHLEDAAERAGVPVTALAEAVVHLRNHSDD